MSQRPSARPRIWPTLVIAVLVIVTGGAVAFLSQAWAASSAYGGDFPPAPELIERWREEYFATGAGFARILIPIHVAIALIVVLAATRSREPFASRLGIVRSRIPLWSWPVLMLATVTVQAARFWCGGQFFGAPSADFLLSAKVFNQTQGLDAIIVIGWAVIGASFIEELVFRGFLLRRLVRRWNPWIGIALTSVLFAFIHGSPYFMAMVLPMGIWLGIVTWRTGSIWPAVACHAVENVVVTFLCRHAGVDASKVWVEPSTVAIALLVPAVLAMAVAIPMLARSRPDPDPGRA